MVYDCGDTAALAAGMAAFERAKREGLLPEWGRRTREMADREFDWARTARLMAEQVYAAGGPVSG